MTGYRRLSIIGSVLVVAGLSVGLGVSSIRAGAVAHRPWLLQSRLRSDLAACRMGPLSTVHGEELRSLEARARDAEACLEAAGRKMRLLRDYSGCISMLMAAECDTRLLDLKVRQRGQDQRRLVEALLPSLQRLVSGARNTRKIWEKYDREGIEGERARRLLGDASALYARNAVEPALEAALGALASWDSFARAQDTHFARFSDPRELRKWAAQVERLLAWSKKNGRRAVLVDKVGHLCLLIERGRVRKRYRADLGRNWPVRKARARDAATPEGDYVVTRLIPRGAYGLALLINYPNAEDEARFRALKRGGAIPADARIGGNIEIHGKGDRESDWTDGCISLGDADMRELYGFAYKGMPVTIVGTSPRTPGVKE